MDRAGVADRPAGQRTPLRVSVLPPSTLTVPLSVMVLPVTVVPSSVSVWPASTVTVPPLAPGRC